MTDDTQTERLIARLVLDARPVRRVPPPILSTIAWLLAAAAVVGAAVAVFGFRPDLDHRMAHSIDVPQMLGAALTGTLAGFAAFQVALPDRDPRWSLLPLPAAMFWVGTMGYGCLAEMAASGPFALVPGVSVPCFVFIVTLGAPLTLAGGMLARHASAFNPGPVAALIGLSAASFASIGLTLTHHLDAAMTTLVWHGLGVLTVMLVARRIGPRAMDATA
jgi:hypothetical protein